MVRQAATLGRRVLGGVGASLLSSSLLPAGCREGGGAARAESVGDCAQQLARREKGGGGSRAGYSFYVPEEWQNQKVRGVLELWSPADVGEGASGRASNLNITSVVVPSGSEKDAAAGILDNIRRKGGIVGDIEMVDYAGGQLFIVMINGAATGGDTLEGEAQSEAAAGLSGTLSSKPGLRIRTDEAQDFGAQRFIVTLAVPEGARGRLYLQTIQLLREGLDRKCADAMARAFMQ